MLIGRFVLNDEKYKYLTISQYIKLEEEKKEAINSYSESFDDETEKLKAIHSDRLKFFEEKLKDKFYFTHISPSYDENEYITLFSDFALLEEDGELFVNYKIIKVDFNPLESYFYFAKKDIKKLLDKNFIYFVENILKEISQTAFLKTEVMVGIFKYIMREFPDLSKEAQNDSLSINKTLYIKSDISSNIDTNRFSEEELKTITIGQLAEIIKKEEDAKIKSNKDSIGKWFVSNDGKFFKLKDTFLVDILSVRDNCILYETNIELTYLYGKEIGNEEIVHTIELFISKSFEKAKLIKI